MKKFMLSVVTVLLLAGGLSAVALPAFPTAEGYGRNAKGGRGGDVYRVTNLNDSGTGSLRYGIESAKGPRTIVFAVSGNIKLKTPLKVNKSYITIAGQTAPGDGITLRDNTLVIEDANNIIVRYIRVRMGDQGDLTGDDDNWDVIRAEDVDSIILDHISATWGIDGIQDWRRVKNITLQWSLYGEALNDSLHHEETHAMLMSLRDVLGNCSIHHNVFFSSRDRHPTLGGGHYGSTNAIIDFRNNLDYNWDGGVNLGACKINVINNYFKPGPSTDDDDYVFCTKTEIKDAAKGYLSSNYFLGNSAFTKNNYSAIDFDHWTDGKYYATTLTKFKAGSEFSVTNKPVTHAAAALPDLLFPRVGASYKRDAADSRIIAGIKNGTNRLIDTQSDVGGWPALNSQPAPVDTDKDGMPDAWEKANGLNPGVKDNNGTNLSPDGYTNLEMYLNSLTGETTQANRAPVANTQSVTTAKNTSKAITLTGSDADGDALTYSIVTQPAHGTLSGSGANRTYKPATNYTGSDSFTFRVNDGKVNSANATVSISVTSAQAGLLSEFFDFTTSLSALPNLTGKTPNVTRTDAVLDFARADGTPWPGLPSTMVDTFASRHTGTIRIAKAGTYKFYLKSDDGSKLWLDGQQVINNDGNHEMKEVSGSRTLTAGNHAIRVEFFENKGTAGLIFRWEGPGIAKQVVPESVLSH